MRKWTSDNSFFQNHTSNIVNYWAGFIAGDGNISKTENKLSINLSKKDKIILENFKKITNYSGPIENLSRFNKKTHKNYESVYIRIYNKQWILDLQKYWNIVPNKSLILRPPNISILENKLSFICGIIDSDGEISLSKNNSLKFGITGTFEVLYWISNILYTNLDNIKYKQIIPYKRYHVYDIKYRDIRAYNLLKLLDKIDLPFKLLRKWNNIQKFEISRNNNVKDKRFKKLQMN